jgi:hypothetical protein
VARVFFRKTVPLRVRLLDAVIATASLAALAIVVLLIDARAGEEATRFVKANAAASGGAAAQLQDGVTHVTRSAVELSYVYGPLMTFTIVAAVLLLVMVRTR